MITEMELNKGKTVYIETYCMEMKGFPTQLEIPKKSREWGA